MEGGEGREGGRGCGGGRAGKLFIFGLFRFIFKQICFGWVVPKYIFGLFGFILKQFYLFRLFHYASETPKQTETKLSMVSKMNRNKRETDLVSVIFGSNRNFQLFVSWTPYSGVNDTLRNKPWSCNSAVYHSLWS